tara:strand:- start:784 stop:1035 length:252 start_codon:yes stop_codon:yes gene_type:complete
MTDLNLTELLTPVLKEILKPIVHDMVDDRFHLKLAESSVKYQGSKFDIQDHTADILNIVVDNLDYQDLADNMKDYMSFTTTAD